MMLQLQLLVLSLALAPNLVSAALFSRNSQVKMIGHKEFKEAMKQNVFILYSVPPNQLLNKLCFAPDDLGRRVRSALVRSKSGLSRVFHDTAFLTLHPALSKSGAGVQQSSSWLTSLGTILRCGL